MSKQLPEQPSLEHLKNEAKALLRLAKQGNPDALKQVDGTRLAGAQLAIAREYGFPSWAKLKRYVEGFADYREAFFAAIRAGDRERVQQLLSENAGLSGTRDPNDFGTVPISVAANRSDRQMIDLLLNHGADIDARSDWWAGSFGALDFADDETSKFLLSKGATLTAHSASRLGMVKELKQILAANPDVVHERGGDGQYPLHFAKTPEIVDILLDAGADIDARDIDHEGTPAQHRILDQDVFRRLIERGAKTDLFMAIALDDLDLLQKHLKEDPAALLRPTHEPGNPMIPQAPGSHIYTYNLGNVWPFQAALKLGRERIYDFLFENSPPILQLLAACFKVDKAAAQDVLERHPGLVKQFPHDPLSQAAKSCLVESVSLMLELGFDVNGADIENMSAIHWAGFHGRDDLVELILPYRPDLEKKNMYGGTVLGTTLYGSIHGWYAKKNNYRRTVELLLKAGSKIPEKASGSAEVNELLTGR